MKYKKSVLLLTVGIVALCFGLGLKQYSFQSLKLSRQCRAKAEQLLVEGKYASSLAYFQKSLAYEPSQAGIETIKSQLTQIVRVTEKTKLEPLLIELGQELIRQQKLHLAQLLFEKLIERSPASLFKAEKELAILEWYRGDPPDPGGTYRQYTADKMNNLYKLLFVYVYPPRIVAQHYRFDPKDQTFVMEIVLDRVYPEHMFRMDWVFDQKIIHTYQWHFKHYRERPVLRASVRQCPETFLFYFFHKHNLLWLEQDYIIENGSAQLKWSNVEIPQEQALHFRECDRDHHESIVLSG
ncbi:hypothetical protein JXQ70_07650 [bacterium]|nr:hypothetical protein [bacterium]